MGAAGRRGGEERADGEALLSPPGHRSSFAIGPLLWEKLYITWVFLSNAKSMMFRTLPYIFFNI
jgi:hypothetical protein